MVSGSAGGSVVGHGHPGSRRLVLRVVRGRGPGHAVAGERQRCRGGSRAHQRSWDDGNQRPTFTTCRWQRSAFSSNSLAVLSTGDVIENPRHLRRKARALARAQRALARKAKGSNNRKKAVTRVAVLHRKVRETRLDAHHKLALRLIRDNQAVYVEDLAVSGLARTRLAKSVHDAGWATLVRLGSKR